MISTDDKKLVNECRYLLLATNMDNTIIYHIYSSVDKPKKQDAIYLIKELAEDEEFNMIGLEYEKDYELKMVELEENETVEDYMEKNFVLIDKTL